MSRDPFGAGEVAYVTLETHERVVELLRFESERSAVVTLVGLAGCGKSTILREFLARSKFGGAAAQVSDAGGIEEIAERLGRKLGLSLPNVRSTPEGRISSIARVCKVMGRPLCVVVDSVSNPTAARVAGRIITSADPRSRMVIARRALDTERDFEADEVEVPPWTRSETDRYLSVRMERAGGPRNVFAPRVVTKIHHLSDGNPADINQVVSRALCSAFERGSPPIAESDVVPGSSGDSDWRHGRAMCYDRIR